MEKQSVYERESIWKLMVRMCLPSVIIMVINVVYSMTDMYFVGMLDDVSQLAAVSLASPMSGIYSAFGLLVGGGGCAVIARALGERNDRVRDAAMGTSLIVGILSGIVSTILILLGMDLLLPVLGVTADTAPFTRSYLTIMTIGSTLTIFSQSIPNIIRAEGSVKQPLISNLLGTFTNILLDPLFILVFGWGVNGAAAATVAGHLVSCVYLLHYLLKGGSSFSIHPKVIFPAIKASPKTIGAVLALGLPNAIGTFLSNFSGSIQNRFYAGYGTQTIAAFSVAGKATLVICLIAMGICIGIQPVFAYFYGAGNRTKLQEAIRKCSLVTVLIGILLTAVCYLFGENLVRMFVSDEATVQLGVQVVKISLISAPLLGIYYLCSNLLQASGSAVSATVASILRQGLVLVPALYLLHAVFGFTGLLWTGVVSDLLSTAIAAVLAAVQLKKAFAAKKQPAFHGTAVAE